MLTGMVLGITLVFVSLSDLVIFVLTGKSLIILLNCCQWFSYLCVDRNTIGHCCCEWFCYFCVDSDLFFCVERYTHGHWSCWWFGYFFGWQLYTLGQFCCHWLIIFVLMVYLLFLCWSDMVKIVVSDSVILCLVI